LQNAKGVRGTIKEETEGDRRKKKKKNKKEKESCKNLYQYTIYTTHRASQIQSEPVRVVVPPHLQRCYG